MNAAPREPLFEDMAPRSVRSGSAPDAVYGMWDWNINRYDVDWLEDLEAILPKRFPKSFRSFISRYIFPQFEFGPLLFLANTPECVERLYELRTGIFEDKCLSAGLVQSGFIQFARPAGGSYDAVCFDTNGKKSASDYAIVNIDHEGILCHDQIIITEVLAPSFGDFIKQHLGY